MSRYQELLEEITKCYFPVGSIAVALEQVAQDIRGLPLKIIELEELIEAKFEEVDIAASSFSVLDFKDRDPLDELCGERFLLIWEMVLDMWWVYVSYDDECIWLYVSNLEPDLEEVD